jgi:hypothetical protein
MICVPVFQGEEDRLVPVCPWNIGRIGHFPPVVYINRDWSQEDTEFGWQVVAVLLKWREGVPSGSDEEYLRGSPLWLVQPERRRDPVLAREVAESGGLYQDRVWQELPLTQARRTCILAMNGIGEFLRRP